MIYNYDYSPKTLRLKLILNYDYYYRCTTITIELETALCYQHCFCNTELRTAIITKIKGLSIQTQQNTFVLFTLFKLTLDERKTLTKVSTCKTSHNHSPQQAHPSDAKKQTNKCKRLLNNEGTRKPVKSSLHNWWRIRSIRISSRNNRRIQKTTRSVLYKNFTLYFHEITFIFLLYCSTNVIRTKHYFSMQVKYYKFQFKIQNTRHYFQLEETISQRESKF